MQAGVRPPPVPGEKIWIPADSATKTVPELETTAWKGAPDVGYVTSLTVTVGPAGEPGDAGVVVAGVPLAPPQPGNMPSRQAKRMAETVSGNCEQEKGLRLTEVSRRLRGGFFASASSKLPAHTSLNDLLMAPPGPWIEARSICDSCKSGSRGLWGDRGCWDFDGADVVGSEIVDADAEDVVAFSGDGDFLTEFGSAMRAWTGRPREAERA